jgi:hypothetical protein
MTASNRALLTTDWPAFTPRGAASVPALLFDELAAGRLALLAADLPAGVFAMTITFVFDKISFR